MLKTNTQLLLVGLAAKLRRGPKPKRSEPTVVWVDGQECIGVPLTKGMVAIVDKEDAPRVLEYFWVAKKHGSEPNVIWYAERRIRTDEPNFGKRQLVKLHQFILPGQREIDHHNSDGLDCRKCNLRPASHSQNAGNTRIASSSKTGFKGVSFRPAKGNRRSRWIARINGNGIRKQLGSFQSPVEAAKAYNVAALERWGEFARLNTIP